MEQDVQKIIKALNECLAALPQQQLQRVTHIGISGQMHGVVFWKSGKGNIHSLTFLSEHYDAEN